MLRDDDDRNPMSQEQRNRFLANIIADTERLDKLLSRLRELAKAELPSEQGFSNLRAIVAQLEMQFRQLTIIDEGSVIKMLPLPVRPPVLSSPIWRKMPLRTPLQALQSRQATKGGE